MDENMFKQQLGKWKEACRVMKEMQNELSAEEWSALEVLADKWRVEFLNEDDKNECKELIQVLSDADKYHANNKDIITWSKNFRGATKFLYLKDDETYQAFRKAMQGDANRRTPQRIPTIGNTETSLTMDDQTQKVMR